MSGAAVKHLSMGVVEFFCREDVLALFWGECLTELETFDNDVNVGFGKGMVNEKLIALAEEFFGFRKRTDFNEIFFDELIFEAKIGFNFICTLFWNEKTA